MKQFKHLTIIFLIELFTIKNIITFAITILSVITITLAGNHFFIEESKFDLIRYHLMYFNYKHFFEIISLIFPIVLSFTAVLSFHRSSKPNDAFYISGGNSRMKVFVAKMVSISIMIIQLYTIIFSLFIICLSIRGISLTIDSVLINVYLNLIIDTIFLTSLCIMFINVFKNATISLVPICMKIFYVFNYGSLALSSSIDKENKMFIMISYFMPAPLILEKFSFAPSSYQKHLLEGMYNQYISYFPYHGLLYLIILTMVTITISGIIYTTRDI